MNLTDELLDSLPEPVWIVYGTATGLNTVRLDGTTTAIPDLPYISPVVTGDRAALYIDGDGDAHIIGPIGAGILGFEISRTTAATIANDTVSAINVGLNESTVYNRGAYHDGASTTTITIPSGLGGWYQCLFSGSWTSNATGHRRIQISPGNNTDGQSAGEITTALAQTTNAVSGTSTLMAVSGMLMLADAATLTFQAYQNSGGNLDIQNMRFSAYLVAPVAL